MACETLLNATNFGLAAGAGAGAEAWLIEHVIPASPPFTGDAGGHTGIAIDNVQRRQSHAL